MTAKEIISRVTSAALTLYPEAEAQQMGRLVAMELGGFTLTDMVLAPDKGCEIENFEAILRDIEAGRPLQYIIGETEFCGLTFTVREGCLIPRPETEELVGWIVDNHKRAETLAIADVGTGSGAIAVSLAKLLPMSNVYGLDISQDALAIARENGDRNGVNITFGQADALRGIEHSEALKSVEKLDIIVSNPPYIPQSELPTMRKNILDFEPHMALFVEDLDPLIFYREIAKSGLTLLKSGGSLYYEIHEIFRNETIEMLESLGYKDIECREDINQKPRMICARRS